MAKETNKENSKLITLDFKVPAKTFEGIEATNEMGDKVYLKTVMCSLLRNLNNLITDADAETFYLSFAVGQKIAQDKTSYSMEEVILLKKLVQARGSGLSVDIAGQILLMLGDENLNKKIKEVEF